MRPRLLQQLRQQLRPGALLASYGVSEAEMALAEQLGLQLQGTPAHLAALGSKAGSAAIFRELQFPQPLSTPRCKSLPELQAAIETLLQRHPHIEAVVVKLNRMAGGRGNAPLPLHRPAWREQSQSEQQRSLSQALRQLAMPLPHWRAELQQHGAIAQEWLATPAGAQSSPSVQLWIDEQGRSSVISSHEQCLGGPHGQSFKGCRFPARQAYQSELLRMGKQLGDYLASQGCRGAVLLDLLAWRQRNRWRLWAIEINLRKGGTTHPFQLAATACQARFDPGSGLLINPDGAAVFYEASDELHRPQWQGLLPEQMLDSWVQQGLYFNSAEHRGCIPMRLGSLSEHGLLGAVAVGRSRREARALMHRLARLR